MTIPEIIELLKDKQAIKYIGYSICFGMIFDAIFFYNEIRINGICYLTACYNTLKGCYC